MPQPDRQERVALDRPHERKGRGPVPAPATSPPQVQQVLALQQAAGNQAAVAAFAARAPLTRTPVLQRADADTVTESAVWSELVDEFFEYTTSMALTNVSYPTVERTRWNEAFTKLWSEAGAPGSRTDAELLELKQAFIRLQDLFVDSGTAANDLWIDLDQQCQEELQDLAGSILLEDVAAAEALSDLYAKTSQRVDMVGEHLVPEDLVALHHMLENGTHVARGMEKAKGELARRKRLSDEFAEEDEIDDPSVAELAWDVVGWDSAGDFAADVTLTIVSGGIGKIAKVLVKGRKASKKLAKLNQLRKLRQARKAKRAKKLAAGANDLLRAVNGVLKAGAADHVAWIKKNWKNTARAYVTDELGEVGGEGGDPTKAKTALERYSKDRIADYVSTTIGISSDDEREQLYAAAVAFSAGLQGYGNSELSRYLRMNLKRRGLSNAVYYAVRTGTLETKLSSAVAVDLAASVAGEMAQDFVVYTTGVGAVSAAAVETARKSIQVTVANWLKDAIADG